MKELDALGEYDRAIIVEYAPHHRGQTSLQRLEKILDKFERNGAKAA